jgi:WD40 repeat protein
VRIWNVPEARLERTLKSPASAREVGLDPKGRFVATGPADAAPLRSLYLFDLVAPPTTEPVPLLGSEDPWNNGLQFSPDGSWLAVALSKSFILWNMAGPRPTVVGRLKGTYPTVSFTPNGDLLAVSDDGVLKRWPLSATAGGGMRELWSRPGAWLGGVLEVDPGGRFAVTAHRARGDEFFVVPLDGAPHSVLRLKKPEGVRLWAENIRLDVGGRLLAVASNCYEHPELNAIRILDLVTGEERTLDTHPGGKQGCQAVGSQFQGWAVPAFLPDGRLVSDGDSGLRIWNLEAGTSEQLRPCRQIRAEQFGGLLATPDSRTLLQFDSVGWSGNVSDMSSISAFDLVSRTTRKITSHGNKTVVLALDARGTILVTGDKNGVVRVGPLTGEEPHLLFGHTGAVTSVAVSPDGRWIASGSDDGTIRLWPMPDMTKPPLHTLPHGQLVAKLRSLTNLRAVRDAASDAGWKTEIGPFPGWATVPEWNP